MGSPSAQLLAEYEPLPSDQKQAFLIELFQRLPPYDFGPLDDATATGAADELAALLDREQHEAR
jgi:hypothetical protein